MSTYSGARVKRLEDVGEGGAISAPPAVVNAVADALAPLGVTITRLPLGRSQVLALLEEAGAR